MKPPRSRPVMQSDEDDDYFKDYEDLEEMKLFGLDKPMH